MRGHPAWESRPAKRHQKTLVLKCKYDYITGNDQQFLGFVKSGFDKKWQFQAEEERTCKGTNKQGNPCRAPSKYVWDNGYCQHHGPNATQTTAPLIVSQPDSAIPTEVLENRDMLFEDPVPRLATAGGRQRDRLMEQPEVYDDDSAYDEWHEENRIEFPAAPPAWVNVAGEVLYRTKWWDINWMRDGDHQVEDGPEQYEDIWEKDLPWYWGRFSQKRQAILLNTQFLTRQKM